MSGTSRLRGEYAKSAVRRREILEASIDVFSTSGYRSGSIREIADRVGMSQAGLLHHFASKSELLQAVLTFRDDEARARINMTLEPPLGVDMLRAFIDLVEYNVSTPGLVALFSILSAEATDPQHPAHEYFRERYRAVMTMLTLALRQAEESGHLSQGVEPAGAARAFIAVLDGLQIQWLLDPNSVDMGTDARRFAQTLVNVTL